MEQKIFNGLFKDLITHLYDLAALETHPLAALVEHPEGKFDSQPTGRPASRGEYLREQVFAEIEKLRPGAPEQKDPQPGAPEWRAYLILQKRFVEGAPPQEVASYLAISDRQLRRDQSRALQALAGRLWDQLFRDKLAGSPPAAGAMAQALTRRSGLGADPGAPNPPASGPAASSAQHGAFDIHLEPLDLVTISQSVLDTLQKRMAAEGVTLQLSLPDAGSAPNPPAVIPVLADRVVLRQVLISLLNFALHLQSNRTITWQLAASERQAQVEIRTSVDQNWKTWEDDEREDLLESAKYWSAQIQATIREAYPPANASGEVRFSLALPLSTGPLILMVDDQKPALQMYQRYLSRTPYKVVGLTDATQALGLARSLQPVLITLDVMMPQVDGWELLQALQLDPETHHIPIVVCSAWEEPELARSLGAAAFLKKPVTQRDLFATLEGIGLPPNP